MTKWVYAFGGGSAEGRTEMRNLLGGKGANLAEMANLGLPVPPGFTITTEVCSYYYDNDHSYPASLEKDVQDGLACIEGLIGKKFGDVKDPLLVSVRSGAPASMPGMMDTVLNLGLNDETVVGLAKKSKDERFALDSYRRFIQMYSNVVLGVEHHNFEAILETVKLDRDYALDIDMKAEDWKEVIAQYKAMIKDELGKPFPQNVQDQLWGAVGAVFGSWMNQRAITYRRLNDIPLDWGTAVNVQAMVFGNMGDDCATGVAFTRNPATGENEFYGEYLVNAQGEDVVAGIRTPQYLTKAARLAASADLLSMEEVMPVVFKDLCDIREKLETHYSDMQDIEFTVQQSKLWMLQTRNGKRTAPAALRIAVDLAREGVIDRKTAIRRIDPQALDQLLHPTLDPKAPRRILTRGLPASPGAACGQVVFSAEDAESWAKAGKKVILVRIETSPEDIGGMHVAQGVLTSRGGMTSHAAVVARGMGRACVSGAGELRIDYRAKTFVAKDQIIGEGDIITLDGSTGEVMKGSIPMVQPELTGDFGTLMEWVDEVRTMKVRTNAETPLDAKTAKGFGAEGIGLCRTEHMFFDPKRIVAVREMILAADEAGRRAALAKIEPYQRADFVSLFEIMGDLPVTVRLLDPPLHEFLPNTEAEMEEVAKAANTDVARLKARKAMLHESNPMLGHRGCRLGVTYPEIYEMQAFAIFRAAVDVTKKTGKPVSPEIMIPLVATLREFDLMKDVVDNAAKTVFKESGVTLNYLVGTMIELPRAALKADEIAEKAEFFSFGTNDLTQTALGISRDDSSMFMDIYRAKGIYEKDPFASLDQEGVGELIKIAVERGRKTRPDIKLGVCGEHGGDPASIHFFQKAGLDYVSCSPYRVPIARLASAQAALNEADKKK